ncbi:transcriptional regulator, partial [Desulfotomaculum sp. OF05-3]
EYNEIMFLREITHTVNAFNDMADVIRLYSKKPEAAEQRLANLLSEVMYEDSESV